MFGAPFGGTTRAGHHAMRLQDDTLHKGLATTFRKRRSGLGQKRTSFDHFIGARCQLIADIEQIEQFYDRNLPLSKETARSLQAFWAGGRMIYSQGNGEDKGCGSDNKFCNTCGGHALVVWVHSG